jgi:NADH-quinone oxidoreductase subunit G
LRHPQTREETGLQAASWTTALAKANQELKQFGKNQIAVLASARATNEELWLTGKLIQALDTDFYDVLPRIAEADHLLVSADRNPNTRGAQLLRITGDNPGVNLPAIAEGVRSGAIKAVVALGEDLTKIGLTAADLQKLTSLIVLGILPNETTQNATVVLPSFAFAEKRGSMINGKDRLQRLNRAIREPGEARDDWEILRDLIQPLTGSNGIYLIEDVFRQMAESIPSLKGLTLSKISDLGVALPKETASEPVPDPELAEGRTL